MPTSAQARTRRRAISPRLAIRILRIGANGSFPTDLRWAWTLYVRAYSSRVDVAKGFVNTLSAHPYFHFGYSRRYTHCSNRAVAIAVINRRTTAVAKLQSICLQCAHNPTVLGQ